MLIRMLLFYALQLIHLIVVQTLEGPPNFNVYNPPSTSFTCEGKVVGGYYADPEADCQLFHICVQIDETQVQDFRFLCPNDTLFDQENFVCADWRDVNCTKAIHFYSKNLDLFKPSEDEVDRAQWEIEQLQEAILSRRKRQMFEAPLTPGDELGSTNFSCEGRHSGGYFADIETDCQVFHICKNSSEGVLLDKKFRCLNGTRFDQQKLFCRPKERASCEQAEKFYNSTVSQHLAAMMKENSDLSEESFQITVTTWSPSVAEEQNHTLSSCCITEELMTENFDTLYNDSYISSETNELNITVEPLLKMFNLSAINLSLSDDSEQDFL